MAFLRQDNEELIAVSVMEPNAGVDDLQIIDVSPSNEMPQQDDVHEGLMVEPSVADPSAVDISAFVAAEARQDVLDEGLARTGNGQSADRGSAPAGTAPAVSAPLKVRTVSGRYRSAHLGFQLELRVDVDGSRALGRLSGDYYRVSGPTTSYFGSWTVDAVKVSTSPKEVIVVGTARTTWSTTFTVATVRIPRRDVRRRPAPATLQWSTSSGVPGASYRCGWESSAFRTVELEQDREDGVVAFASYDTGSLTSGGPARKLTTERAYTEAGIQVIDTGGSNTIATSPNHVWNNASLHDAMVTQFSRWQETAQFKVWLLHAMRHEYGPGLRGIMFDSQGLQRQGCASFYQAISAGTPENLREQLYVNVHELGHCFNLFHSFHKTYMDPPLPNRPGSLSWLNYPQNYNPGNGAPGGAAAFWAAFPFEFDVLELAHLRHGFRNDVIMGGHPFGTGAAFGVDNAFSDPLIDTSGLELRIAAEPDRATLGTPIVLKISLKVHRAQIVHDREQLHPKYELVQLAITRPRGDTLVHHPPVVHCAQPGLVSCDDQEVLPISAYVGYDAAEGAVFEDPGSYRIRAAYTTPEGTHILSNITTVRVAPPRTADDERVADLLLQDDVGMVLTLLGTDSHHLSTGTEALEAVLHEHPTHPDAVYARLALGTNAARPFTHVGPDGSVTVRDRDLDRADALLFPAIDASRGDEGLDDLTVFQVMSYLADSHGADGDTSTEDEIHADALALAHAKGAPTSVVASLEG